MLSQNELRARSANRLRRHDLIAERVRKHAVLVNSSGMGERIVPNYWLIRLRSETDHSRKLLTRPVEQFCIDAGLIRQTITADAHDHHDFFESSIAGSFSDAVDRALHLACSCINAG